MTFTKNTNDDSYEYYVKEFLDSTLNQKYSFSSINKISYNYALFWRHLYEHNFSAGTTDANRMALLRESAKVDTSSNLASINAFMDGALKTTGGNFTTFASALKDFAERAYFHDTAYHNWDDPNKNNFYTAISSYTEAPETFNGTLFDKQYKINNSYAFRSHKIAFAKKGAVNVKFTTIATGGSMASFYAKVNVADKNKIYDSREITLAGGIGNAEICLDDTAKRLIVLVTRLDVNEGQYPDYKITVTPLNLAFTAAVKSTNLPFEVAFTNTSTANMLGYTWDFGDGEKSDEKSPTHVYKNTNAYDVTLNYKGCSTGVGLQKKAYITFLPYIEKVEIHKINDVTNAFEFKREFKTDKFQFSVGAANNYKNSADLLVKVTTSGKLQNMQLTITDGNGASVFSSNSTIPIPSNNRIWEFLIPAASLKWGIHLVSISSADVANNKLLCDPEFQTIPYNIDEPKLTWSTNSGITGIDKNYYFYVEPTQPPTSEIQILTENECNSSKYSRKATFVNNSNKNYTVDFGDGTSGSIGPYSVEIHYYSQDINTAIIKTLNSVYQEIATSHSVNF